MYYFVKTLLMLNKEHHELQLKFNNNQPNIYQIQQENPLT